MMCGPTPPLALMMPLMPPSRVKEPEQLEVYGADRLDFWNDPLRWRGIRDPQRQMMWDRPKQQRIVTHVDEDVRQVLIWKDGRYQVAVDSTDQP